MSVLMYFGSSVGFYWSLKPYQGPLVVIVSGSSTGRPGIFHSSGGWVADECWRGRGNWTLLLVAHFLCLLCAGSERGLAVYLLGSGLASLLLLFSLFSCSPRCIALLAVQEYLLLSLMIVMVSSAYRYHLTVFTTLWMCLCMGGCRRATCLPFRSQ